MQDDHMGHEAVVIGAGPAGLACAAALKAIGGSVTLSSTTDPGSERATSVRPFGSPPGIATSSKELVAWCDGLLRDIKENPIDRQRAFWPESAGYRARYTGTRALGIGNPGQAVSIGVDPEEEVP